mgnify:CR=1 FL=1
MIIKLPRSTVFLLMIFLVVGCAGIQTENTAKYDVLPFRNPSYQDLEFSDVGMRFTNAFAAACAKYSLDVSIVISDQFESSKDTNVQEALLYARDTGADYIIYGYVTKWENKPTMLTSEQDFAGFSIFVRSVESGEAVFSSEIQAHGIRYSRQGPGASKLGLHYTGTRVDLIRGLATEMAEKLLGQQ